MRYICRVAYGLGAALSGTLGIAPTANLNRERKFPSMFEPIHGSAFDITCKGIANPIATFCTASMMLDSHSCNLSSYYF